MRLRYIVLLAFLAGFCGSLASRVYPTGASAASAPQAQLQRIAEALPPAAGCTYSSPDQVEAYLVCNIIAARADAQDARTQAALAVQVANQSVNRTDASILSTVYPKVYNQATGRGGDWWFLIEQSLDTSQASGKDLWLANYIKFRVCQLVRAGLVAKGPNICP